jgi:hypothetical protein
LRERVGVRGWQQFLKEVLRIFDRILLTRSTISFQNPIGTKGFFKKKILN